VQHPALARKTLTISEEAYNALVKKQKSLREAYSQRKIAKITFEEFENMTGEVLGE